MISPHDSNLFCKNYLTKSQGTMAENPSNFVRDWISENVRSDPFFNGHVEERTERVMARLKAASKEAEIPQDDPELAPDLLRDLIQAAIEKTYDPSAGLRTF